MPNSSQELPEATLREIVVSGLESLSPDGKRFLLIVPDSTRSAPVGQIFKLIYDVLGPRASQVNVMIALGTHPPMSEEAILARLDLTASERVIQYGKVGFINHRWSDPDALAKIGAFSASEIAEISQGAFSLQVDVTINRAIFEYDELLILGPVFPHEVAGFSGGAKYLFPGISGPELLNFFHWLGAWVTNVGTIGHKWTAVRDVIHRAARMVPVRCHAFCMVVEQGKASALTFGDPETAWSEAADLSSDRHVIYKNRRFNTVLSCAPAMYQDLWVGGKCMYKLEPVVEDGGELIIFAPLIKEISPTHGHEIRKIGYHVFDYFAKQWDRFKDEPWGVLAHSTHVKGQGTFEHGLEKPRIRVTLATGIPPEVCKEINLGYRDPASIRVEEYWDREEEGILLVPNAGEILYRYQP